jgi:hypothetical protein
VQPRLRSCFINPVWLHSARWHSRARRHGEVAESTALEILPPRALFCPYQSRQVLKLL